MQSFFFNKKKICYVICSLTNATCLFCRKLADKVAAAGFFVVVPDFFYGDPYVPATDGSLGALPDWLKGHGTV